ncbi:O-antigen ligase family protein [Azospirillum agricola]|uniref:O-antigen ligase family protein n=1 Tax=Azospirillum agricola TaxID=1720247 RepID=UPI000A0F10B5|nr:O-antigen ligase family protein [Azospirillum agricola]SMH45143.1 O-antigen ligase [Azospirillum lipoferum]
MAISSSRHDSSTGLPDAALAAAAGTVAGLLGPLAALAPRGLPVWAILFTVIALAGLARRRALGRMARSLPAVAVVGAFLLLALLSTLWSPSGRDGVTVLEIAYIALGALAGGAWVSQMPGVEARRLAGLFLAGFLAGVAVFGVEALLDFPLHRWWNAIPDEELIHLVYSNVPKRTAALLCLLVWPAALVVDRAGHRAAALLVPVAYALVCLPLTSRSAILGIAVGIATFALACWSARRARQALGAILAFAFVAVVPVALFLDRVLNLEGADWLFHSARHRIEIWGLAANRALQTPLLGQGIDSSRALTPQGEVSRFVEIGESLLPLHPHNAFLQVWLELGGAGAALALGATLMLLAGTGRMAERDQPFALALFATALAMGSTAYGIWQAWWMAGFLAAGLVLRLAARVPADER